MTRQLWKRLDGEFPRAFEQFLYFLLTERDLKAVAKHFGVNYSTIRKRSYAYTWKSRAAAYDLYSQKQASLEAVGVRQLVTDWKTQYDADQAEMMGLRRQIIDTAKAILDYPVSTTGKTRRTIRRDKDGRIVAYNTTIYAPPRWSLKDAAQMIKVAEELGRLTLNMPSDVIELLPEFVSALRRAGHDPLEFMRVTIDRAQAS